MHKLCPQLPFQVFPNQAPRIAPTRPPPHQRRRGSEEIGAGLFEAIEELERMAQDPSDVLVGLVYFAQEGRDSYSRGLRLAPQENRFDAETAELVVSIAGDWVERPITEEHAVGDVVALPNEMECVGLDPGFGMVEKLVALYWNKGKKDDAVAFLKEVLRRGAIGSYKIEDGSVGERGGPVGYLVWKMMVDGNYLEAVKLVIDSKENGLKPEVYSYTIALTALVKKQNEFSKALN